MFPTQKTIDTLDYYVDHPTQLFDPVTGRFIVSTKDVVDALEALTPSQRASYLRSLYGEETEDEYAITYYLDAIKKRALQEILLHHRDQYQAGQRIKQLLSTEHTMPLSPEQQAQFDSDWLLLTYEQLQTIGIDIPVYYGDLTSNSIYNTYYNALNGIIHPKHTFGLSPISNLYDGMRWLLFNPIDYWIRGKNQFGSRLEYRLSISPRGHIFNALSALHNSTNIPIDVALLKTLNKDELISYFDVLMVTQFNRRRNEMIRRLEKEMESGQLSETMDTYTQYLDLENFKHLLDEFSIEYDDEINKAEAVALIERYFDLHRLPEERKYRFPSTRKLP